MIWKRQHVEADFLGCFGELANLLTGAGETDVQSEAKRT